MIKKDNYTLYLGSMLDVLDKIPENSIDAVVTDPPYEINFMSKGWDNTGVVFKKDTWEKVLRVLKPGGQLLAFNHSRTFHRMAVAIEDAGFQIRDTIMWMYGSGFPKSHNISIAIDKKFGAEREVIGKKIGVRGADGTGKEKSMPGKSIGVKQVSVELEITKPSTDEAKQWDGWGTALKPSYEPIIMARKPLDGTIADNVLKHGVGGINIDECRVGDEQIGGGTMPNLNQKDGDQGIYHGSKKNAERLEHQSHTGRFPANTIHDGSDEVTDGMWDWETNNDASRFFYTAKASKKDRDEGLDGFQLKEVRGGGGRANNGYDDQDEEQQRLKKAATAYGAVKSIKRNIHPTVKPTDLMQYLVRLVTPKGGKVLDPFMGSGSTGKAAMIENNERNADYHFIGIDLEQEYIDIAEARIEYGVNYRENKALEQERETLGDNQIRLNL